MSYRDGTWTSEDAKRARKRVVRESPRAYLTVAGVLVRISKTEAYRLIDTGKFTVHGSDAITSAYLEVMR